MDLCGKSSGLADFENTVDRAGGSAVIFDAVFGLCLSYVRALCPKRDLDHRSFFTLDARGFFLVGGDRIERRSRDGESRSGEKKTSGTNG